MYTRIRTVVFTLALVLVVLARRTDSGTTGLIGIV